MLALFSDCLAPMRIPRIYHATELPLGTPLPLSDDAVQHVVKVLRLGNDAQLRLFNGDGHDYHAKIVSLSKRQAEFVVTEVQQNPSESPLKVHLGQGISRGERMDFVLQKSVELGVTDITPLFTERCGVKLQGERLLKKQQQWQRIVISACEQCGRSVIPTVHTPQPLSQWLQDDFDGLRLTLDPEADKPLRQQQLTNAAVQLLIGPEGGLSDAEIEQAATAQFQAVQLGPRVLRTETAALAAITCLQYQFGDLAN